MKLVRYGERGSEKPGLIDAEGRIRDLSAHVPDIAGDVLADLSELAAINPASLPDVEGDPRLGACVGQVGKFIVEETMNLGCIAVTAALALHAAGVGAQPARAPIEPAPSRADPGSPGRTDPAAAAPPARAGAAPAAPAGSIVPLGIGGTGQFGTAWYVDLRTNHVVACSVLGPEQTLRCVRADLGR